MKSLLLLLFSTLLCLSEATTAWRFVSKVEELPVEITDRLEVMRPKVRVCGGDSDSAEATDCVLCTVCHPHEYELIGCSGQMDSICASCTTGWMRTTPKTSDFFHKCKKHPQFPLLYPDLLPYAPYRNGRRWPMRLDVEPSLFAEQEKMLRHAEKAEMAERDDELSDEDDYDLEDEEEDEELFPSKEEDESKETGVKAVDVDERDDGFEENSEEKAQEVKDSEDSIEIVQKEDIEDVSREDDARDVKAEDRADPFDSKKEEEKSEEETAEDDEESEEVHRLYPLHRANIWRIIGPELAAIDDKDIAKEVRKAINDRMDARQMDILNRRLNEESGNILEIAKEESEQGRRLIGGYRPLLVRSGGNVEYTSFVERISQMPRIVFVAWMVCFSLSCLLLVVMIKMFLHRRRHRVIILPELDEMSRQLINEAHARVHAKNDKKTRPEFV